MKPDQFIPLSPAEFLKSKDIISDDLDRNALPAEKTGKNLELDALEEGIRLYHAKDWENALQAFLEVDKTGFSSDQRVEIAYYLGLCYAKTRQYEEAVLYLEQVIISGGDVMRTYQCRMTLAYIYVTTGRGKMAEYELRRLLKTGFESAQLYNTLAYVAYTQKRYRNAVELYEKALDLDKDNATALNSMGYILADTGIDRVKGLRLCRKAVDQKPQSPVYLDSLGWAYYKCGETVEARSLLKRAMELAPNEQEIKKHLMTVSGEAV